MTDDQSLDQEYLKRLEKADVLFVAQDGYKLAPARVRCYSFAKLLNQHGFRSEVLSFYDHLGAAAQGGPVSALPEEEKLRLNLIAYELLSRNPRAVLYVQKCGYHTVACMLAAARNGNRLVLDYDDYDLDGQPFRRLEPWLPSLKPDRLFEQVVRQAAACIASSRRIHELMEPLNANTHLIHTVADQDLFNPDGRGRPRERFGDSVNILWGGDVWGDIPMKDIVFGVDAFALMPRRIRSKARFHLIGFGRAWEELKRRLRMRHPDMDNLVFHEHIPPSEFGSVLAEMDIGVLPYADNQFNASKSPTKMFEYMLAKVAVCATPIGEVKHCLEDGTSVLLGAGLAGFSRQLARLIDDDGLRRSIADTAYRRALENYSLQGVGKRLAAILHAVTAPPTTSVSGPSVEEFLANRLGRRLRIAPREVLLTRRDLQFLATAPDLDSVDPRRWSAPLIALLGWYASNPVLKNESGIEPDRLEMLRLAAARNRNAARLRPLIDLPAYNRPAGPPALSKLAAAEDWEDADWFAWAQRFKTNIGCFPMDAGNDPSLLDDDMLNHAYSYFKRSRGPWERVQFLYGLDRAGLLGGDASILIVSPEIDGFYLFLTEWTKHVDVLDIGAGARERAAHAASGEMDPWLLKPRQFRRDRISLHREMPGSPSPDSRQWDAVVIIQNGVFLSGPALLEWATARLRPGGTLAFSAEVLLTAGKGVAGLRAAAIPDLTAALGRAGLEMAGTFDASLSDATLDRFVRRGTPDATNPHFITQTDGILHMPAVWFFRKPSAPVLGSWDRIGAIVSAGRRESAPGDATNGHAP